MYHLSSNYEIYNAEKWRGNGLKLFVFFGLNLMLTNLDGFRWITKIFLNTIKAELFLYDLLKDTLPYSADKTSLNFLFKNFNILLDTTFVLCFSDSNLTGNNFHIDINKGVYIFKNYKVTFYVMSSYEATRNFLVVDKNVLETWSCFYSI